MRSRPSFSSERIGDWMHRRLRLEPAQPRRELVEASDLRADLARRVEHRELEQPLVRDRAGAISALSSSFSRSNGNRPGVSSIALRSANAYGSNADGT